MKRFTRLLLAASLLTAAACENPGGSDQRTPARLDVVSGGLQSDTVGKEVAQPLVVRVVDDRDRPVRNQLVNFVVAAGGGSVFAGAAVTNADGEARERWTLGTVAGDTQRVEARAVDASTGQALVFATFRAVARPDVPAAASIVGGPTRAGTAGAVMADSLVIKVADRYGNGISGVAVAFAAANGGAVSPATPTTGADGTARAQWTLGGMAGAQSATATAAGFPALTFSGTAAVGAVTRVALTPEAIRFNALNQTQALTVQAFDAFGNMVGGQQATIVSQNAAVVALDPGALARAVGNGTTGLIATIPGSTAADTTVVTVHRIAAIVRMTVDTSRVGGMRPGDTLHITARAYESTNGTLIADAPIQWASSAPGVATVNQSGHLTMVGAGEVEITASTDSAVGRIRLSLPGDFAAASVTTAGSTTCALKPGGATYCWGSNLAGAVGAPVGDSPHPVAVSGGHSFALISAGSDGEFSLGSAHVCAVTTGGQAYCWGYSNSAQTGRQGDLCYQGTVSTVYCVRTPALVGGDHAWRSLSAGGDHTCGLTTDGTIRCWGSNRVGQLGATVATSCLARPGSYNTAYPCSSAPVEVPGSFTQVSAGAMHTCALASDGTAYCWGSNEFGQLGTGAGTQEASPVAVATSLKFTAISAGFSHTCARTADGAIYCWGANGAGQLGTPGGGSGVPVRAGGAGFTARSVTAGTGHTCALGNDDRAYCWGYNGHGQLGTGATSDSSSPVPAAGGRAYAAVRAGHRRTCAIQSGSQIVFCWGSNASGALGVGSAATFVATPSPVRQR